MSKLFRRLRLAMRAEPRLCQPMAMVTVAALLTSAAPSLRIVPVLRPMGPDRRSRT